MLTFDLEKQGERITFFAEADSTATIVELEVSLAPGEVGPPSHIHTKQSETFHVVSGQMVAHLGKQNHIVEAGETLVVEAGQAHTFANGSESDPLVMRVAVEPALHFQWFLTEMAESAIRGGGSWKDIPLLELAYMLFEMRDQYRVSKMPTIMQSGLFGFLSQLAQLFGKTGQIAPKAQ